MRVLSLVVLFLLLLPSPEVCAEEPARIDLKGTVLTITPPAGEGWTRQVHANAPGQWVVTFQRDDVVLQAAVIPFHAGAPVDPIKYLSVTVRRALPAVGVESRIGTPKLEPLRVLGYGGAKATLSARRKGRLHGGRARVLRAGAFWGLAWGLLPTGSTTALRDTVIDFVASLQPKAPSFFTPQFHHTKRNDQILIRPTGEEPIRFADLVAMERLTELSAGGPMCLSRREQMRRVLLEQATRGDERFRDGMREAAKTFKPMKDMSEAQQRAAQEKLAESIYHGFLGRYVAKDEVAQAYMRVRNDSTRIIAGKMPDPLRKRDLDNLMEMFGFLGSIASDTIREVSAEQRDAFLHARVQAWPDASAELQAAWATSGADWLRLRYAWDQATPAQRFVFRKAVRRALGDAAAAKALDGIDQPHALKRYLDEHGPVDMTHVLDVAARMSAPRRQALLKTLPTWPATVPLGW